MLGVHTAGSRRVLGGFSARSRQNLGKISAKFRRSKRFDRMYHLSLLILEPKGAKRRQKEAQRQPKGAKREAKGSPGGGKTGPKTIQNRSCIWKAVWDAPEVLRTKFFLQFWLHFGSILEAKFDDFSCYFLASFFD